MKKLEIGNYTYYYFSGEFFLDNDIGAMNLHVIPCVLKQKILDNGLIQLYVDYEDVKKNFDPRIHAIEKHCNEYRVVYLIKIISELKNKKRRNYEEIN